jgi:hypothetical protein
MISRHRTFGFTMTQSGYASGMRMSIMTETNGGRISQYLIEVKQLGWAVSVKLHA